MFAVVRSTYDQLRSLLRACGMVSGGASLVLGLLVVLGWHIGSVTLVQLAPTLVPMQYNTALGFICCGLGLLMFVAGRERWAVWPGLLAVLIGSLTLLEYSGDLDLGIDEVFMRHDITVATSHPGRMAPNTAVCFLLIGSLVVASHRRYRSLLSAVLASLVFGLGVVALSGYLAALETAYGWGNLTRMAVHTSLGFVVLSLGFLCDTWRRGVQGDTWLPRWLPAPVAIGILTAAVSLWQAIAAEGHRLGSQYEELSDLSNLAGLMLILGILLAVAMATSVFLAQKASKRAREVSRVNLALQEEIQVRQEAERALEQHRDNLEELVAERTQELELARKEAESANEAKSDFLSHMSHELRTPLNGILGYAQILQRDSELTSRHGNSLSGIISCGDHLLALINDVLDLSKIEAGRLEIEEKAFLLEELVGGVANVVKERAERRDIGFHVKRGKDLPKVLVSDAGKLRQIVVNLLGNAVKFTHEGRVDFLVSFDSGLLHLEVRDTGIGMDPDEIEQVFDPFKQVEAGKAAGGTGLGLAITQRLVSALGGTLTLESQKGKGSQFHVSIPVTVASVGEAPGDLLDEHLLGADHLVLQEGQDWTILVADDRADNRNVMEGMLAGAGFQTLLAEDGDEALDILAKESKVDLVLMDVRMPRVSGLEALKQIRADSRLQRLKVIAVTASVFPEFREEAIAAGFDDFLGKPFRVEELLAKLKKHLDLDLVPLKPPESGTRVSSGEQKTLVDLKSTVPAGMVERLTEALHIRNLTAIKAAAEELSADSQTDELGRRILDLAQSFNFAELKKLVRELE